MVQNIAYRLITTTHTHTILVTVKGSKNKQNDEKSNKTKHFAALQVKSNTTRQA